MYSISKEFSFDYGHRVYLQKLDRALAGTSICKCRHLHGHTGTIKVVMSASFLNETKMVTDFNHLNWFKKLVDEEFDHKLIMDVSDPLLAPMLRYGYPFPKMSNEDVLYKTRFIKNGNSQFVYASPDLEKGRAFISSCATNEEFESLIEFLEGLVVVNFVPTSENFAKFFFCLIQSELDCFSFSNDIKVRMVEFKETPKTSAVFSLE